MQILAGSEVDILPDGNLDYPNSLLKQLDLVISVDTSIAHLAGALGKSTWVLLGEHSDWRWQLDREDSDWYPTMKLIRQTLADNWQELMDRVVADLVRYKS